MGILKHVDDRKIRPHVAHRQRGEGDRDEAELRNRRRAGHSHQNGIILARPDHRHTRLDKREGKRQHERIVAGFGDHRHAPLITPRANARNASLRPALWRGAEFPFVVVLPVTLLLQSVGDVLRHIGLVVLSEHAVGPKGTSRIEGAFGDHALPFAEKIRQQTLISDRNRTLAVGHLKTDGKAVAAPNAALLHEAANADARARFDVFFHHVGRRIEEDDGLLERAEHQSHREREHAERSTDEGEASLLAGHRAIPGAQPSRPSPLRRSSSRRNLIASPASARRASTTAARALSGWPSTIYERTSRNHPSTSAPSLEPPGAPARSTRASARRSKSSHGASGGAASISARQVAAACVRSPSCSAASPRK